MQKRGLTIPNIISLTRLILIPYFIYLFINKHYIPAIIIMIFGALSDALDGFIARKFNMRSRLGSLLDPAADKTFMILSFCMLAYLSELPWWLTGIVLAKDFGIIFAVIILNLLKIKLYYRPTRFSKSCTASQMLLIALTFFKVLLENHPIPFRFWIQKGLMPTLEVVIWIVALLTIITTIQYIGMAYKFYRYGERKNKVIGD